MSSSSFRPGEFLDAAKLGLRECPTLRPVAERVAQYKTQEAKYAGKRFSLIKKKTEPIT